MFIAIGAIASVLRGQDANWDLLNYHYYNAWAFAHSRYGIDRFAAEFQSYFDPALDLPYYFLVANLGQWPKVVSAVMGMQYGLVLYILYLISDALVSQLVGFSQWQKQTLALICVSFAAGGSALWSQAGTTTNEVSLAVFVLLAVLIFLRGVTKSEPSPISTRRSMIIGALVGAAVGLKLTAVTYVPALGLAILLSTPVFEKRLRAFGAFGLGVGLAFGLSYLPWGAHLYRETGNPLFPMFNNVFHSPLWAEIGSRDTRYLPKTVADWAFYPLKWALSASNTVSELPTRDPRIAFLYLVIVLGVVARVTKVHDQRIGQTSAVERSMFLVAFIATFSYFTWLALFSILRYAIPVESLICVLVPVFIGRACDNFGSRAKSAAVIAAALLVIASTLFTVPPNTQRVAYADRVFSIDAPTLPRNSLVVLADEPIAFMAPFLHERQPSVSFVGTPWYLYNFRGYGVSKAIAKQIRNAAGPLFVAYYFKTPPSFEWLSKMGVRIDFKRCRSISTNVSADIALCEADLNGVPGDAPSKFKLVAKVVTVNEAQLNVRPVKQCAPAKLLDGTARVDWKVVGTDQTELFVNNPPSEAWNRLALSQSIGTAEIAKWLQGGLKFELRSADSAVLATARIEYEPCD